MSCSSLWTHFRCPASVNKIHTYLERSKSSPINLRLRLDCGRCDCDTFFQVIPHAIGRLKSMFVEVTWGALQDITAQLSRPEPLLEMLEIDGGSGFVPRRYPELTTALFDGDLSSLCVFCLAFVRTELPWRNMTTLTSFALRHTPPDDITIRQLLDFFEGAPCLREIELTAATLTSGAQDGRLVSFPRLERIDITGNKPLSFLLNHMLIPVGATVSTWAPSAFDYIVENHFPRSLDNLRNLSGFTKIHLFVSGLYLRIQFSGPNGKHRLMASVADTTWLALEFLTRFNTSKVEQLEIHYDGPLPRDPTYQAFLPMENLRTLTLSDCQTPHTSEHVLDPNKSPLGVVVFPKLEEISFIPSTYRRSFDVRTVTEMAAARASRGAKLTTIRIVDKMNKLDPKDISDLRKHVLHVEHGPNVVNNDSEDSDDKMLRSGRFR